MNRSLIGIMLLVVLVIASMPALPQTRAQSAVDGTAYGAGGCNTNVQLTGFTTTQSKDLIVVFASSFNQAIPTPAISDTSALTWTRRAARVGQGLVAYMISEFTAVAASPLSSDTITVNLGGTTGGCTIFALGISGLDTSAPFDTSAVTATGTSTNPTVSITTSKANDFVVGAMQLGTNAGVNNCAQFATAGSGFTLLYAKADAVATAGEYQVDASTGAFTVNFGATSCDWVMLADAFVTGVLPSAPSGLTAVKAGNVILTWSVGSAGSSPITSYNVYRGGSSGSETLYATSASASYNDHSPLSTGYYQTSETNGFGESARSAEVSVTEPSLYVDNVNTCSEGAGATIVCTIQTFKTNDLILVLIGTIACSAQPCVGAPIDTVVSVADSATLVYTLRKAQNNILSTGNPPFNLDAEVWYAKALAIQASDTITITLLAHAAVKGEATIMAVQGLNLNAPFDTGASFPSGLSASGANPSITTTQTNIYNIYYGVLEDGTIISNGNGYIPLAQPSTSHMVEYAQLNTTGAHAITYVVAADNWAFIADSLALNTVPNPPVLTATEGQGNITLTWSVPFNGGTPITGYKLYRSTVSGGEILYQTLGNVTSFNDVNLNCLKTYYYQVTALNAVGESVKSNEANARPACTIRVYIVALIMPLFVMLALVMVGYRNRGNSKIAIIFILAAVIIGIFVPIIETALFGVAP